MTKNFHHAFVWTAVLTALLHVNLNFSTVVAPSLQAINEPIMYANNTPELGKCMFTYTLDFCLITVTKWIS